jgi:hypothetical protein
MDINSIFERVRKDTSILAEIDIDELLQNINDEKNDYLDNKTLDDILDENINALKNIGIIDAEITKICNRLIGYRYIDNIYEIHKGKQIRWIRPETKQLTNGGIVLDVKFLDNGCHILCKNLQHRLFQIKFNECTIFQKLSTGEQLILMAYEHLNKM